MLTHAGTMVAAPALPLPAQEMPALTSQTWAALLILDADCRILAANPAAEALVGMAEGHLRGQRFCEAFCPSPCEASMAHSCTFGPVLRGRERRSHPRWITIHTATRTRTVLLGAAPNLAIERKRQVPRGAIVTLVPSELLDDADRRRREMIAGALHDLRHGMAVQTLISDLLVASTLSGEAQTLVERLRHSSSYLLTCIDDLLNRSRYDLTDLHLRSQATVVSLVLQQVAWQLEPLLMRRKQRILIRVPDTMTAWADPSALEHVVMNLLLNAHKYSREGDRIIIGARSLPEIGMVELTVRDHGPGVPASERRRVFDRFYRGTTAGHQQGAGLGLAIVHSLVTRHGGIVGVRAARGGGAVFWLRLPAHGSPDMPAPPS